MGLVESGKLPKPLTKLLNISRKYSLWMYQWGLACCAIEMAGAMAAKCSLGETRATSRRISGRLTNMCRPRASSTHRKNRPSGWIAAQPVSATVSATSASTPSGANSITQWVIISITW